MKIQSKALQAKKRRQHIFYALSIISIPVLSFAGLSWVSYVDRFQISSVQVQGTKVLSAEAINALAESSLAEPIGFFFSRSTPVTYPKSKIKKEVEDLGYRVKKVDVSVKSMMQVLRMHLVHQAMCTSLLKQIHHRQSFSALR